MTLPLSVSHFVCLFDLVELELRRQLRGSGRLSLGGLTLRLHRCGWLLRDGCRGEHDGRQAEGQASEVGSHRRVSRRLEGRGGAGTIAAGRISSQRGFLADFDRP